MNKNGWMMGILILVVLFFIMQSGKVLPSGDGSDISDVAVPKDTSIIWHFADENMNPVGEGTLLDVQKIGMKESNVLLTTSNGTLQFTDVFLMRFDVAAKNTGVYEHTVTLTNVKIVDADGNPLSSKTVSDSFRCVLNKPKTIAQFQTAIWSTDPKNTTSGCSSIVWMPTTIFESTTAKPIAQPLKLVISAVGQYNFLGVNKIQEKEISLTLTITNSSMSLGAFSIDVSGGEGTVFLSECNMTPPATAACPGADMQGSSCYNSFQTCALYSGYGLWPGCSSSNYDSFYVAGMEINGGLSKCKDGKDNDCDGTADKNGTTSPYVLPRDADCPDKLVSFRTNADVLTGDTVAKYINKWVSIDSPVDGIITADTDADGKLDNVGYWAQGGVLNFPCNPAGSGYTLIATSPTGKLGLYYRISSGEYIYRLYEITDADADTKCDYSTFNPSSNYRCAPSTTPNEYAAGCLNVESTIMFGLNGQERYTDY